jgi:hypothetical protein
MVSSFFYPFFYADCAVAVVVILIAPLLVGFNRWWLFPVVGAVIGAMMALVLGATSQSPAVSVLLLAFLVPIGAVIVGYCRNPTARSLTVAGLWLAFVVWVLRALPFASDTLRFAAFVLPVMFLFLVTTIVAYQRGAVDAAARGRTTIELNGLLMFLAAAFAYPDRDIGLYVLIAGSVICFLGLWGLLLPARTPTTPVPKAAEQGQVEAGPAAQGAPVPPKPARQFCPSCGSDNEGDSAFCRKCGRAFAAAPAGPSGAPPRAPG